MKKVMYSFLLIATVLIVGIYLIRPNSVEEQEQDGKAPELLAEAQPSEIYVGAEEVAPMIASGDAEAPVWNNKTPAAHRARIIYPDPLLLAPRPSLKVGDRLSLAVFDNALLTSEIRDVTEYPNGAVGMTARMDGNFKGILYLSYSGGELRAHADVLGGNDFYVRYDPNLKAHVAIEIDRANSDFQDDCETCLMEHDKHLASQIEDNVLAEAAGVAMSADGMAGDEVIVDVMVVYTPAALSYEGGTNGMNNNIALAMQKGNTTHGNSNTKVTLQLVHSAETAYTESGNPSDDLRILRYTGSTNSAMDEVHTWRDTYSADFVCLFENEPGTGGVGYLLNSEEGRPETAFNLSRVQQTDTGFTVVHELGHNMGCAHSKTQATQQGPGLFSYSAGWQWADTEPSTTVGYCSVMTYENFDSAGGWPYEYERVPHFSNPDIDYTGDSVNATGHAIDGDNARTIRNVRHVISDYRIALTPVTNYPCSNNFETAYSPWRYYGSDIDWERDSGGTLSPSTGPSDGYDGDWYIYVESSTDGEGFPNKEALLQAAFDFSTLASPEISFAYHMYGSSMGSLALEASADGGTNWSSRWSMNGDLGDTWFVTNINLSAYAGNSNTILRFKGVTGSSFRSDMALDAIVISNISNDSDGDGIPNYWETLYFGGSTNAVPTEDSDSDNYNNLQEYIAGLNPTNSDGLFLTNLTVETSNAFDWNSASGRIYSVYWSDNLLSNFTILQSNLTSGTFTDAVHGAESEGFYKLEVEVAP